MHLAIITKFASTKSGARVPFDLAPHLTKKMQVSVFAQKKDAQKDLHKLLAARGVRLYLYSNPIDLYQKLKKANCHVISSHATLPYLLSCKLTGIPIIKTYHGTQFDAYLEKFLPGYKINFVNLLINRVFNHLIWLDQKVGLMLSNQTVSISKACQKELRNLYKTRSKLIYNGVSFIYSNKSPTPTKAQGLAINILSVSRITPYKGFHLLIDCIQGIRKQGYNLKLTIAGSVGKKAYLSYLKGKLREDDQIFTNLNDKNLAKLYGSCDIYATCDRYLFFGLPIAEAAIFAKPAVALDFFAAKELIVHGKTGYVAENMAQFSKFLKHLISNPKKRQLFGAAASQNMMEKFSIEKTANQYASLFQKFAGNR